MAINVTFTDTSTPGPSGPITAWSWDFGDSGTSTSQNPTHSYAAAGEYSVTLTITGSGSDGTSTTTLPVVVVDVAALTAAFTFSPSALAVTFTDTSTAGPSGPITGWAWDFGDSATSTSQNPSHTYAAGGTYTVTLTVTGTAPDGTDVATQSVSVAAVGGSFVAVTSWARPAFTVVRDVPFTTKTQLDNAIANMQPGDRIHYAGTGVLTISSGSTFPYSIVSKNPGGAGVLIDFGTSRSIWAPGNVSGNYVKFDYTGTGSFASFKLSASSNLHIYGGDVTASNAGLGGMGIWALSHDILWWDLAVHDIGGSGVGVLGNTSGGATSQCYNLNIRAEVDRFAMRPSLDNHVDKGTGIQACILHGSSGNIHDSTFTIYGHDPLRPGETSAGKTWPEGAGGSVIELGNDVGTDYTDCVYYALGVNMLMEPNGTNPGSTGTQTGGNVINVWGKMDLRTNVIQWAEGQNCTGAVVHGASGAWHNFGSPSLTVNHGRHTNTNQYVGAGGNISAPYDSRWGIDYNDCT